MQNVFGELHKQIDDYIQLKMFIVAITGGIASGKSTVANVFKEAGVPVVDADLIARQGMKIYCTCTYAWPLIRTSVSVVERGQPAYNKIRQEFGPDVFTAGGDLNRAALGDIIFDSNEKRATLNSITHPAIHRRMYKAVMVYFLQGHKFIVMELPLLFESG